MPQWLRIMLLAAGLLIGAAFLAELVLAIARRRRQPVAGNAQPENAQPENPPSPRMAPRLRRGAAGGSSSPTTTAWS